MLPTSSAAASRARARIAWDAFLLKDNERLVMACVPARREEAGALARAGSKRADVAAGLLDGHVASALALYREAAVLYMAAFVAARTGETPPEPFRGDDVLARFRALAPATPLTFAPAASGDRGAAFFDDVRAPDPRAAERLGGDEAQLAGQAARAVVDGLAALVEPRQLPEIHFARRARVSVVAVASVALVAWVVATLVGGPIDLALHKPVTTSGVNPAALSPPSGLTDGVTLGSYGVHTSVSSKPWVTVDLLQVYLVDAVTVYNRGDGWYADGLPMTVQLSENGTDFVDVETSTRTFGQISPWKVKLAPRRARYVRVQGKPGTYVALTELEVFGRRP